MYKITGCKMMLLMFLIPALNMSFHIAAVESQPNVTSQNNKTASKPLLGDPELRIFSNAVVQAGLSDLFEGTGPFTGFIPANSAFEKLGKSKLNDLLKEENRDQLNAILIYHIVPGKYMSKNLKNMSLRTVNGKNIEITVENGQIKVNNAKVIRTDLVGPNGVIHVIDTVLIP